MIVDLYTNRDDQHTITQSHGYRQRYDVATLTGDPVGAVYYTTRGYTCWRFGEREHITVRSLGAALAHYRGEP